MPRADVVTLTGQHRILATSHSLATCYARLLAGVMLVEPISSTSDAQDRNFNLLSHNSNVGTIQTSASFESPM